MKEISLATITDTYVEIFPEEKTRKLSVSKI
jgi:hypothetical protein